MRLSTVLKRLIDIAGAFIGLFITLLISIPIIPAIILDSPGPPFFKQRRVGLNRKIFMLYKFRSMCTDAEEKKDDLNGSNNYNSKCIFKIQDDPRITRLGKFIRHTSLDEFPQFFNVLKGDMSLVGTRPPTLEEVIMYEKHHWRRLYIKPGITGLWQIEGRKRHMDFEEIVKLDVKYIEEWSLLLDFKILLKTLPAIFHGA